MFNLDLDNLPRAVRAMKCQALAGELAKLHVAIMSSEDEPTRKALNRTANAIEKSIELALGTPEQRAFEQAQSLLEGALAEAMADTAKHGRDAWQVWLDRLRALRQPALEQPSDYTSDAEAAIKRVQEVVANFHMNPDRNKLTGVQMVHALMGALRGAE